MTGPEHYVQAEMLLDSVGARDVEDISAVNLDARTAQILAAAAVHATLAQAAAIAEMDVFGEGTGTGRTIKHSRAWRVVLDGEVSS